MITIKRNGEGDSGDVPSPINKQKENSSATIDDDIIDKYKEAEIGKTTVWWHVQHKIITELDNNGSDNIELKAKLVEELRRRPNPDERQTEEFMQIIKDHEAWLRTRDYDQTQSSGKNKERTQTDEEWIWMNDNTEKVKTQI